MLPSNDNKALEIRAIFNNEKKTKDSQVNCKGVRL